MQKVNVIRSLLAVVAVMSPLSSVLTLSGWPDALGPSSTPLSTAVPILPGGTIANDAPPGPLFQDFKAPFPTDTWWVGLGVGKQDQVAAGPFPFQSYALPSGIRFGLQTQRTFDGTSVHMNTLTEWSVNAYEVPGFDTASHKATQWDTQTLTIDYFSRSKQNHMLAYMVPGSPYMTFEYQNATPFFNTTGNNALTSINGAAVVQGGLYSGTTFQLITKLSTYVVYFLTTTNVTLQVVTNTKQLTTLVATTPMNVVVRFAKVTADAPQYVLDTYSSSYAKSVAMAYTVLNDIGQFKYTWQTGGSGPLMLLSWPHHRKTIVSPNYVNGLKYMTIKGLMKPVLGSTWTLQYNLPKVNFFALNNVDSSCLSELNQNLAFEISQLSVSKPGDFYFWGGSVGRMSRLALIAEHIGRSDLIQTVVDVLKKSWSYWDLSNQAIMATYETNYGGFINGAGWNNTWVDFGNGYYNDHHFHYGYSLHTAAVIGRYDPQWLADHQYYLLPMARDICNMSPNDPHFTVARHVDFFAGHSWASGIANGAGSRDQESTTEAVNGYYGCYLYALTSNNVRLRDWSRLLLAQEQLSAQLYWHMNPNETVTDDTVYPEQGMRNLATVGNVMDYQSGAWLFWGAEKVQIAAIQILPLTPVNTYLYEPEWMDAVMRYADNELSDPAYGDEWKSVIWAAYSQSNPQAAYKLSTTLHGWGSGNSASNTLYFIATQKSNQPICNTAASTTSNIDGQYYLQDTLSGQYVVSTSASPTLKLTSNNALQATLFRFSFLVNARSIQNMATGLFVTADANGNIGMSASRASASSYEAFGIDMQIDGTIKIKAFVNGASIMNNGGTLLNNVTGMPLYFNLVQPSNMQFNLPSSGLLMNVAANKTISVNSGNNNLRLSTGSELGVVFNYTTLSTSAVTIANSKTKQFVTGDPSGNYALLAARPTASSWEKFSIMPYSGCQFVILCNNNNMFWSVDPSGTLFPNGNAINAATLFIIPGQTNCTSPIPNAPITNKTTPIASLAIKTKTSTTAATAQATLETLTDDPGAAQANVNVIAGASAAGAALIASLIGGTLLWLRRRKAAAIANNKKGLQPKAADYLASSPSLYGSMNALSFQEGSTNVLASQDELLSPSNRRALPIVPSRPFAHMRYASTLATSSASLTDVNQA